MSVDGKGLVMELPETQQLSPPGLGLRIREDTTMKEMALIKDEPISVSHKFQGRLPRVSPVEEITKVVCRVLQVCGFQQSIDGGSILLKND